MSQDGAESVKGGTGDLVAVLVALVGERGDGSDINLPKKFGVFLGDRVFEGVVAEYLEDIVRCSGPRFLAVLVELVSSCKRSGEQDDDSFDDQHH